MEFFIKKNNIFPLLLMKVINDGKENENEMKNILEKSTIEFSMISENTGIPLIHKQRAFITNSLNRENEWEGYYIFYQFTKKETAKSGRFRGEFTLNSNEGRLILPIRDDLFINIKDSIGIK